MSLKNISAVMVAERSIINIINHSIYGLIHKSNVNKIYVVVPSKDLEIFRKKISYKNTYVVCEDDLISIKNQNKIKKKLGRKIHMYGWYLQQFLKFEFINYIEDESYLIWDADTVLLKDWNFNKDILEIIPARENHKPYFTTLKKVTGISKQVNYSFISQFIVINRGDLNNLIKLINNKRQDIWYLNIIDALEKLKDNEFSEYETYGNYFAYIKPRLISLKKIKWFRYGAAIISLKTLSSCNSDFLEKKFNGYQYVAFERHNYSLIKKFLFHVMVYFKF